MLMALLALPLAATAQKAQLASYRPAGGECLYCYGITTFSSEVQVSNIVRCDPGAVPRVGSSYKLNGGNFAKLETAATREELERRRSQAQADARAKNQLWTEWRCTDMCK